MSEQPLSPNAQLAVRALAIAGARELDQLHTVCAKDVVLEFPFFWHGGARSWTGLDEMIRKFSVENVFTTWRIDIVEVFDAGDTVIIEATSEGVYPTDREPYRNHYLYALTCKDGKITRWNEFFNPLEVMKQGPDKSIAAEAAAQTG